MEGRYFQRSHEFFLPLPLSATAAAAAVASLCLGTLLSHRRKGEKMSIGKGEEEEEEDSACRKGGYKEEYINLL